MNRQSNNEGCPNCGWLTDEDTHKCPECDREHREVWDLSYRMK